MLTFIYSTCRKEPKFEWFVDSLHNQVVDCKLDANKIQIVMVDFDKESKLLDGIKLSDL